MFGGLPFPMSVCCWLLCSLFSFRLFHIHKFFSLFGTHDASILWYSNHIGTPPRARVINQCLWFACGSPRGRLWFARGIVAARLRFACSSLAHRAKKKEPKPLQGFGGASPMVQVVRRAQPSGMQRVSTSFLTYSLYGECHL